MAQYILIHPELRQAVPFLQVVDQCSLFQNNPQLLATPYQIRTVVSVAIFQQFLSRVDGNPVDITNGNFNGLHLLCQEFGFEAFAVELAEFHPTIDFEHPEAVERLISLEERTQRNENNFAALQAELGRITAEVGRLSNEIGLLNQQFAALRAGNNQEIERQLSCLTSIVTNLVNSPDDEALTHLKSKVRFPLKHVLLPQNQRFQIQTNYSGRPQSLTYVDTPPDWPGFRGSRDGRLLALVEPNLDDPNQQFYFRDLKCRVITSAPFPRLVLDDVGDYLQNRLYLHPHHGGKNQLFWFDGQSFFGFRSGSVLTIDDSSEYRVRACAYAGTPNQRFSLVLIPSNEIR